MHLNISVINSNLQITKVMKKIIFTVLATSLAAVSCNIEYPVSGHDDIIADGEGFRLTASVGTDTKTVIDPAVEGNNIPVEWEETDALSVVVNGENHRFTKVNGEENVFACAEFTPSDGETCTYNVFYPYMAEFPAPDENGLTAGIVTLPIEGTDVQSKTSDFSHVKGALIGQATAAGTASPAVELSHLTAVIALTIENAGDRDIDISRISLSAGANTLSGNFNVDFDNKTLLPAAEQPEDSWEGALEVADGSIAAGSEGVFYIVVPPFTVPEAATDAEEHSSLWISVQTRANSTLSFEKQAVGNDLVFAAGGFYETTLTIEEEPITVNGVTVTDLKDNINTAFTASEGVEFEPGEEVAITGIYNLDEVYNRLFFDYDETSGEVTYIGPKGWFRVYYSSTLGYMWIDDSSYSMSPHSYYGTSIMRLYGIGITAAPQWNDIFNVSDDLYSGHSYPLRSCVAVSSDGTNYTTVAYLTSNATLYLFGYDASWTWINYTIEDDNVTVWENNSMTWLGKEGYYRITFIIDESAHTATMDLEAVE